MKVEDNFKKYCKQPFLREVMVVLVELAGFTLSFSTWVGYPTTAEIIMNVSLFFFGDVRHNGKICNMIQ